VSLSTFVERKDVKEYLRLNVAKPWFQVRAEIKAPPLTTSYGWTGTAFDYAMRFYLQKLNPSAKVSRWLAEESAALVVASRRETARTKKRVLGIIETAKDCVRSYLKSKRDAKPGRELIRATQISQVRSEVSSKLGTPTSSVVALAKPWLVEITGPAFFDFIHGQVGLARNCIEIHPVMEIKFLKQQGDK
jgi:hypothetical protein